MKNIKYAFFALPLLATGALASAHDRDDEGYQQGRYEQNYRDDDDNRYDDRYESNRYNQSSRYEQSYGRYDYAQVVRVERLGGYGRDYSRQCYDNRSSINNGAVIGAVAGGVIGNQVGSGYDRGASTAAGALIGGLIGQSVDRNNRGVYERHYIECRQAYGSQRGRNADYRVTYRYHGRLYSTIMPYNPGGLVRVRMDMRPQYERRVAYRY